MFLTGGGGDRLAHPDNLFSKQLSVQRKYYFSLLKETLMIIIATSIDCILIVYKYINE